MFWQRFYDLCVKMGTKPNPVGKITGISSATITQWKQGSIPSGESLAKIADYFDCSIDYLLGRTDNPQSHKNSTSVSVGDVSGNSGAIGVGNTVTAAPLDGFQKLLIELYNNLTPEEQVDLIHDLKNKSRD